MLTITQTSTSSNHDVFIKPGQVCGLHGMKFLSSNRLGDIFWRGNYVRTLEQVAWDNYYDAIQELGLICCNLERLGIPVNAATAGTHAHWFSSMHKSEPYKACMSRCPEIYVGRDRLLMRFKRAACEFDDGYWHYYLLGSPLWQARWTYVNRRLRGYPIQSLTQSSLEDVLQCLVHFNVPENLLAVMAKLLNPGRAK